MLWQISVSVETFYRRCDARRHPTAGSIGFSSHWKLRFSCLDLCDIRIYPEDATPVDFNAAGHKLGNVSLLGWTGFCPFNSFYTEGARLGAPHHIQSYVLP